MAVFTEMFKAGEWTLANSGPEHDHVIFGEYWDRPRTVEIGGKVWSTSQTTLDRVAAGKARFDWRPEPRAYHPEGILYLVEHEGTTLADREENWSDDSDWYVLYWDAERGVVGRDGYRTTRGGGTDSNYAVIDATPEVIEAVRAFVAEANYKALRAAEDEAWLEAARDATEPDRKGARVKVVKGRKVPIGTEGEVFWVGDGYNGHGTRVGLRTDDGVTHWTDGRNIERIVDLDDIPGIVRAPEADLRERAKAAAERTWTARGANLGIRVLAA